MVKFHHFFTRVRVNESTRDMCSIIDQFIGNLRIQARTKAHPLRPKIAISSKFPQYISIKTERKRKKTISKRVNDLHFSKFNWIDEQFNKDKSAMVWSNK